MCLARAIGTEDVILKTTDKNPSSQGFFCVCTEREIENKLNIRYKF